MEQPSENFRDIAFDDVMLRPELITRMFSDDQDMSILLEKRGKRLRVAPLKIYDKKTTKILEDARREHMLRKRTEYTREQAFKDFMNVQEDIRKQLNP